MTVIEVKVNLVAFRDGDTRFPIYLESDIDLDVTMTHRTNFKDQVLNALETHLAAECPGIDLNTVFSRSLPFLDVTMRRFIYSNEEDKVIFFIGKADAKEWKQCNESKWKFIPPKEQKFNALFNQNTENIMNQMDDLNKVRNAALAAIIASALGAGFLGLKKHNPKLLNSISKVLSRSHKQNLRDQAIKDILAKREILLNKEHKKNIIPEIDIPDFDAPVSKFQKPQRGIQEKKLKVLKAKQRNANRSSPILKLRRNTKKLDTKKPKSKKNRVIQKQLSPVLEVPEPSPQQTPDIAEIDW